MIKNKKTIFSIGMISLAVSLLLTRFGPETRIVTFLEGMFMGMSLALNLFALILYRIEKNKGLE